jgi:uncharacterized protein DUF2024
MPWIGARTANETRKENTEMKVAVYDTHVTKKNGGTMHFDIIVSEEIPWEEVLAFGKDYLQRVGQEGQPLSARECEFCHIEQARPNVEQFIRDQGFHIVEIKNVDESSPSLFNVF